MKHLIWIVLLLVAVLPAVSGCAMDAMDSDSTKDPGQGDPWPEPDPKIWSEPPTLDPSLTLIVEDVVIIERIEGIDGGPSFDPPDLPEVKPAPLDGLERDFHQGP